MAHDARSELTLPVGPRDHAQGREDAPLTLVEYGDYQCPYCGQADATVKELQGRLGADLRVVFRNFPLTQVHEHAEHAAEAAEAAAAQGRFWQMHDELFAHQRALDDAHLEGYANALGLDADRFVRDMSGHANHARIEEDYNSGVDSGVPGTPTFFINGMRNDGAFDFDSLLQALEAARP